MCANSSANEREGNSYINDPPVDDAESNIHKMIMCEHNIVTRLSGQGK